MSRRYPTVFILPPGLGFFSSFTLGTKSPPILVVKGTSRFTPPSNISLAWASKPSEAAMAQMSHGEMSVSQGRSPKLTWVDEFFVSKRTPALAATGGPCPSRCPRDTVEISRVQRCSGSTTAFGSPDLSESLPVRATHRRELLSSIVCHGCVGKLVVPHTRLRRAFCTG